MARDKREQAQDDGWASGPLRARPGGPAERFADRIGLRHPAAVFFAALFSAFAVLIVVSLAVGYVLTHVLLDAGGLGLSAADNGAIRELVKERSGSLDTLSAIGSTVGGAPVLPILVALVAIVCAFQRRWRIAAFAVFVLSIESATYRITSLVLPRQRPDVARLEDLPANASYPSGHTAASIAVYAGLVFLLVSGAGNRTVRAIGWVAAIVLPVFVAMSRMYRGMHHPLDVAGGILIGVGAMMVLLFACRAAGVVAHAPARERRTGARQAPSRSRRERVQATS
jgi:membrane-associated phospholipid phosphatase